jgi:hypothetical protein
MIQVSNPELEEYRRRTVHPWSLELSVTTQDASVIYDLKVTVRRKNEV